MYSLFSLCIGYILDQAPDSVHVCVRANLRVKGGGGGGGDRGGGGSNSGGDGDRVGGPARSR